MKYEKTFILLDLGIFFLLFFGGMGIGLYISKNSTDVWNSLNGMVISVVLLGELIWWKMRQGVVERLWKCFRQFRERELLKKRKTTKKVSLK